MITINQLIINKTDSINILIPPFEEKFNYFYEPTKELHLYDQITIELHQNNKKNELMYGDLETLYDNFFTVLEDVINDKDILQDHFNVGFVGHTYNTFVNSQDDDALATEYSFSFPMGLCNNGASITWIYSRDDIIYLEISPLYPWLYYPACEETPDFSFEEFMKNYKPIGFYTLDKNTVKEWRGMCKKTLDSVLK